MIGTIYSVLNSTNKRQKNCQLGYAAYRTNIRNLKTAVKNVKTGVEELRNEVAILKEANNKIPLESPPKQNHKVNTDKTTQTTQTIYKDNTAEDNSIT